MFFSFLSGRILRARKIGRTSEVLPVRACQIGVLTYLLVVSSPCSTHSGLKCDFHLNFGLPRDVGPSASKLMIFFIHVESSPVDINDQIASVDHRTSSIWWIWILLLRFFECFCSILTLLNQRIIAWSHLLIRENSFVDRVQVSLPYRRKLLTQALNTFPRFTRYIPLFVSIGRSSLKA